MSSVYNQTNRRLARCDDYAAVGLVAFAVGAHSGVVQQGVVDDSAFVGGQRVQLALFLAVLHLVGVLEGELAKRLCAPLAIAAGVQYQPDLGTKSPIDHEVAEVLKR